MRFTVLVSYTRLAPLFLFFSCVSVFPVLGEFKFTAIPDQDTARLQKRFGEIADYLSEKLGVEVKYIPVKDYAGSVQSFKNNEVQLAWFGGLSGVKARLAVPGQWQLPKG